MTVDEAMTIMIDWRDRADVDTLCREAAVGRMYEMDGDDDAPAWVEVMIREVRAGRPFPGRVLTNP